MSTFDPDALECLAAIVEEGGFERAAARLSITQSAVSQRLRALEAQVGTVLLVRSRPVKPTSAGRLLIKHAMQMRLLRSDLEGDLQELTPGLASNREEERIAIAVNADSIATWVLPALRGVVQDGLPLEIITDDQDFTHEWLREGQVLVAALRIEAREAMPDALVVDRLAAGLEIENLNLSDPEQWSGVTINGITLSERSFSADLAHEEYRDDRYVAALKLERGSTAKVFYLVRAVTPGAFVHPAATVEDMYRPERYARSGAGTLVVKN